MPDKQKTPLLINPNNYYLQPNPKINVVTRNRPNLNTFDRQIIKRARRPNMNTMSHSNPDNPSTLNTPISVATQTDKTPPTSNIGQGRDPIDEKKHAPLFEFENETAPNNRLTKAKLAALKQSYAFHLSQNPVNINELSKRPTARVFKERSPGHAKPFIIATSSSAADFMLTPKRSTVSTIARSPPLRNIRKSKAEATVKKLNVEKAIANISLSPTTDDSTQEPKREDTTIIDLLDTSDDTPPQVALSINPNCITFGQDIIILSSDSQDSFHTASVNSAPTQNAQPPEPMDWTPDQLEPERDTNTQDTGINVVNENTSKGL